MKIIKNIIHHISYNPYVKVYEDENPASHEYRFYGKVIGCTNKLADSLLCNVLAIDDNDESIESFDELKLILKPLDSLNKKNTVWESIMVHRLEAVEWDYRDLTYKIIQALLSEHYDVFGLIEDGYAIPLTKDLIELFNIQTFYKSKL